MNLGDLASKIQANKAPLAIAGAVGVAGLALVKRQQAGGDGPAPRASAQPASATSAGSLAAYGGTVPAYSSGNADVYNALQPLLEGINEQLAASRDDNIPMPEPIAATIYAPRGTGKYVRFEGDETINEVQADGSLYHLTPAEWFQVRKDPYDYINVQGNSPTAFNLSNNLTSTASKSKS